MTKFIIVLLISLAIYEANAHMAGMHHIRRMASDVSDMRCRARGICGAGLCCSKQGFCGSGPNFCFVKIDIINVFVKSENASTVQPTVPITSEITPCSTESTTTSYPSEPTTIETTACSTESTTFETTSYQSEPITRETTSCENSNVLPIRIVRPVGRNIRRYQRFE